MEPKFITIENGQVTVRPTKNGIWLTQNEIARLFEVFVPAVNANIRSILKKSVLREEAVCKDIDLLRVYNMEMITALAFRLKSGKAE
ncbi:MAG: protein-tyrosine kinase [Alistipes sp.]|nr:protein-tyrosine kinase [Alistipes sp.]